MAIETNPMARDSHKRRRVTCRSVTGHPTIWRPMLVSRCCQEQSPVHWQTMSVVLLRFVASSLVALGFVASCGCTESEPDTEAIVVSQESPQPSSRAGGSPIDAPRTDVREPTLVESNLPLPGSKSEPELESLAEGGTVEPTATELNSKPVAGRDTDSPGSSNAATEPSGGRTIPQPRKSLADLLVGDDTSSLIPTEEHRPELPVTEQRIDNQRVSDSGIRRLIGNYVTIYTDIPPQAAVDELPAVFDQAVPQWARYFHIPREKYDRWKMVGYIMKAPDRFQRAGLLPADLPQFLHGYQRNNEFWMYEQEYDYYRRHLMLHEATHGFMNAVLGGAGPPWYMEGMAEHLGTHSWQDGKLTLAVFPTDRRDVPGWGRVKLIKDEFAAGRGMMLRDIMLFDNRSHLQLPPYAWSWAAVTFLDSHPEYRMRFRSMQTHVHDNTVNFSVELQELLGAELREVDEQWQMFVVNMEYGYDIQRNAVQFTAGEAVPARGASVRIQSDRGWQSSGYRFEAGHRYRISATGRVQIAERPEIWWSEANGITIDYFGGFPLGMLMGKVRLDEPSDGVANLVSPSPLSDNQTVQADASGTLYLKINDHPSGLADNVGEYLVRLEPLD